ncbi:hypothetical protein [Streptomyces sp. FIT100]|uniref:hypothetical protein n=1 Tax=Streptomyces sp. FIT100 TaxID=2837956 RepID=UPI0021C9C9A7|nr:hypothetical protein [Streptomyces sp. FIT100]UUN29822.1 hypothetical protein KK483_28175 [Streptomyces sp. FIT100]
MALRLVRRAKQRTDRARRPGKQPRRAPDATPSLPADPALPPTTGWLLRGKDGRLTAYAPGDQGILRWTETRPGGPEWDGPTFFPVPDLLPHFALAQGADGYVHLAGTLRRRNANGESVTEMTTTMQYQSGRPMRQWHSMGTPYPTDRERAGRIGFPSSLIDPRGALHVFIRNAEGGVTHRPQSLNGRWGSWADLKGGDVRGVPAVATTDAGLTEVVAVTETSVLRWVHDALGAPFERADDIVVAVVPGSVSSERTGRGRLTHFWREAATGTVQAWREGMDEPAALGGTGGWGPLALLRTPVDGQDCTIMAQRGPDGRPALAAYPTENESAGAEWTSSGEPCVGVPALAVDGSGRVVLTALGADGTLRVTRQKAESGLAMEPWTTV